jgi:hypothetical protein
MEPISYSWNTGDRNNAFDLVFVGGMHGRPYSFGERAVGRPVERPSIAPLEMLW